MGKHKAEVVDGLKHLLKELTTHKSECDDCPYNPSPGEKWVYGCTAGQARVIEDAIRMIENRGAD